MEAVRNFRCLIQGSIEDGGKFNELGRYKPWELGRLTVWQLRYLFGGKLNNKIPADTRGGYLYSHKLKGTPAFEVWRQWKDEIEPGLKAVQDKIAQMQAMHQRRKS